MELEKVRIYEGKRVYLILKNNFNYTCDFPKEIEQDFKIVDKFGSEISINCEMVNFIQEVRK